MKLRQQSVETLNKLFAETADLSGRLTDFPTTYSSYREMQRALCQTLGIVQMICRVMLEETGEIKPLDLPEAEYLVLTRGVNKATNQGATVISAEPYALSDLSVSPSLVRSEYCHCTSLRIVRQ